MTPKPFIDRISDRGMQERLLKWLEDPDANENQVPIKVREKFLRISAADDLIRKYGARSKVVEQLQLKYPELSKYTLIRDYEDARLLFNSNATRSKNYERDVIMQWLYEDLSAAREKKDWKATSSIYGHLYKFGQFYLDEEDYPQTDLEPHNLIIVVDPEVIGIDPVPNLEGKKRAVRAKIERQQESASNWIDDAEEVK